MEDTLFTLKLLKYLNLVVYMQKSLYYYRKGLKG